MVLIPENNHRLIMLPEQAFNRIARLCSRSEKCIADVQKKLNEWKISPKDAAIIIAKLQTGGFINEQRYACAFVHDKNKLAHWGVLKIKQALQIKKISPDIIDEALQEIDAARYQQELEALVRRKNAALKADTNDHRKAKLLRFALSRGYEYATAYETVMRVYKEHGKR